MTNTLPDADITSIIPIVITLGLSLGTRNVVIGLFAGVVSAVIMLVGFNPLDVMTTLVKEHLVATVSDSYNAGGNSAVGIYWRICDPDGKVRWRPSFCALYSA